MLIPAKLAYPVPWISNYLPDVFSILLEHPTSLINSPPGCFQTSQLAGWLKSSGLPFAWLRLDPADQDPGTLLMSLLSEVQQLHPSAGEETSRKLERLPGPIYGWAPLFASLAREITERVKHPFVIVLDHFHHLHANRGTLDLLAVLFIPLLPQNGHCIIITHQKPPGTVLPGSTFYWDGRLAHMDQQQTIHLFNLHTTPLQEKDLHKIVQLTEGREGLLSNLIPFFQTLDKSDISSLLKKSNSTTNLLRRVVDFQAASLAQDDLTTLLIAQNIDYCHPSLIQKPQAGSPHNLPIWIQPLAFDWKRIRCSWKEPLWNALQQRSTKDIRQTLEAAAQRLVNLHEEEQAVALYMRVENYPAAAQTLATLADRFMVQGRWYTLERWINRLPAPVLHEWPQLLFAFGEICASMGNTSKAQRAFAISSTLFQQKQSIEEACQSLLAESAVAQKIGNTAIAQEFALKAREQASQSQDERLLGLTMWQLAALTYQSGERHAAVDLIIQAVLRFQRAQDISLKAYSRKVEPLAVQFRSLQEQKEFYRRSYEQAETALEEAAEQFGLLLQQPQANLPEDVAWNSLPLFLKISAFMGTDAQPDGSNDLHIWMQQIVQRMKSLWQPGANAPAENPQNTTLPPSNTPLTAGPAAGETIPPRARPVPLLAASLDNNSQPQLQPQESAPENLTSLEQKEPAGNLIPLTGSPAAVPASEKTITVPKDSLSAQMLGKYRIEINGQQFDQWTSAKARSVFQYMLTHRKTALLREVLMDTFWPNASLESARNNLNVTVYHLRQSLRAACGAPILLSKDGGFQLNPDL